jgi:tyrosine aminotransferase
MRPCIRRSTRNTTNWTTRRTPDIPTGFCFLPRVGISPLMSTPNTADAWQEVAATESSLRTINPIRAITDHIKPNPNIPLKAIPLSIGDPSLDGNLLPPSNYMSKIAEIAHANSHNGYAPAVGTVDARASVAEYLSTHFRGASAPLTADDVVLSSGASHALEMCLCAMLNPGDEILLPAPGFSLYSVIASNRGFVAKYYNLLADKDWECDLAHVESLVTPKTKAILITNPSNPCGSNFARGHVEAIVAVADKLRVPIIADEIYAGLTFDIHEQEGRERPVFTSVAEVSTRVPCLIAGGTAKTFVVPGHRVGWVARHDPLKVLGQVWLGITKLATLIVGPNHIMQGCMRTLLQETPQSYHYKLREALRDNARVCCELLGTAKGLTAIEPHGAMYLLVRVDMNEFPASLGIRDDTTFASRLVQAKNVIVLPGSIFHAPGFIRIVFTKPADQLREALARIVEFCEECREGKLAA